MRRGPSGDGGDHEDTNDGDDGHEDAAQNPDQVIAATSQRRRALGDQVMSDHFVVSRVLVLATSPATVMTRPCHRSVSANTARTAPIMAMARASKNQARSAQGIVTVTLLKAVESPEVTTSVSGALPWSTSSAAEPAPLAESRHISALLMSLSAPAPEA